jgi:lysophospholipase L1-like esterase
MNYNRFFSLLVAIACFLVCNENVVQYACAELPGDSAKLPKAKRIVFLGDSITYAGGYVSAIETAWIAEAPDQPAELINLGLPSETVSGLSEPGHAGGQFPRPNLHERLTRILDQTKPDLVIACYGMNDGIYYPNNEMRFSQFKSGMERLHKEVTDRGSSIIHLTPAFFDALPIQSRLLPAGRDEYPQPYAGYDDVLEDYSKWLLSKRKDGWIVLDLHAAMKNEIMKRRLADSAFTFASDGVHPNAEGQAVIARPLAEHWGLTINDQGLPNHPQANAIQAIVAQKQSTLKHAWLTATRHLRPGIETGIPIAEAESKAQEWNRQARLLAKTPSKN